MQCCDREAQQPRPTHDDARRGRLRVRIQQRLQRRRRGDRQQRAVVAVDGLGPRLDRPPGRDLEQVGGAARIGEREVERLLARAAVELDADELGRADAGRRRIGRRKLDERLVG